MCPPFAGLMLCGAGAAAATQAAARLQLFNVLSPECTWLSLAAQDAGVPKEPKHPLWELRTKEEAQEFWQREFGHLNTGEGEEDPLKARRKTTFF